MTFPFYELKDGSGNILSFGITPYVIEPGQVQDITQTAIEPGQTLEAAQTAALSLYESRCKISVDKSDIDADGVDIATVTVSTNQAVGSIAIRVEALDPDTGAVTDTQTANVVIVGGSGTALLTSDNIADLVVTPDDRTLFFPAGRIIRAR